MVKCCGKIRILPLQVWECADFSTLQTTYPYVAPMEELASNVKVWIFPKFCHHPKILASRQLHAPCILGIFAYIRIFSSIRGGGVRILTGSTLLCVPSESAIYYLSVIFSLDRAVKHLITFQ